MFKLFFSILGTFSTAAIMWIGVNVSHIPLIEQKLDLFRHEYDNQIAEIKNRLDRNKL